MISLNKYRAIKKKRNSMPLRKLHTEIDDRGRPKLKTDYFSGPKGIDMTPSLPVEQKGPVLPYNNPESKPVLNELDAVMPSQESTRSNDDHQKDRKNLLKPLDLVQVELLEQILEELKKFNGHV